MREEAASTAFPSPRLLGSRNAGIGGIGLGHSGFHIYYRLPGRSENSFRWRIISKFTYDAPKPGDECDSMAIVNAITGVHQEVQKFFGCWAVVWEC